MSDTRGKLAETEKITINLGLIDLGHVDLLVQEGHQVGDEHHPLSGSELREPARRDPQLVRPGPEALVRGRELPLAHGGRVPDAYARGIGGRHDGECGFLPPTSALGSRAP